MPMGTPASPDGLTHRRKTEVRTVKIPRWTEDYAPQHVAQRLECARNRKVLTGGAHVSCSELGQPETDHRDNAEGPNRRSGPLRMSDQSSAVGFFRVRRFGLASASTAGSAGKAAATAVLPRFSYASRTVDEIRPRADTSRPFAAAHSRIA